MSAIRQSIALLVSVLLFNIGPVFADGEGRTVSDSNQGANSERINDKRLPALLPGEEVKVGGNKIKVWTTAGEVPVSQPPEPWNKHQDGTHLNANGQGISVIVDDRKKEQSAK